ncbi:hypothetical protein P43SY_000617 [Pythium insidiosum]|uniref:Uncharacterized protein n=1 Tax=Pythium insidiosum TaxID=114742 RepID=A0AAD5LGW6_PYTIN|nr:hypothetical protein P43SY_000617 [Pythium insidiosum]
MAWVNRTSRDQGPGNFKVSTAASHLGPGQYESSPTRKVKPNIAPFGSTAQVDRGANGSGSPGSSGQSFVTPGPGTYQSDNQAPWESPSRAQSSIFQSKTTRDTKPGTNNLETPGPGAYTKQDSFGSKKKKTHTSLGNLLVRESTPKNKIRWARLPTAPSIPTQAQSFGYEQGPYGKLVRHEPAQVGHTGRGHDTTGPGEYDPLRGIKSIHKPRATDFSKSKIQSSWNGPGATGIFKSSTDRLKDKPRRSLEVPGPGHYSTPTTVVQKPVHIARPDVFVSSEPRFKKPLPKVKVPGPGHYHPQSIDNEWNRPTYNISIATEMELAMLR